MSDDPTSMNPAAPMSEAARDERLGRFDREIEEILDYHIERFYSKRIRARAEAGPGLFGQGGFLKGGKGTDYWTMDYAKENVDFCLYDVAVAVIALVEEGDIAFSEIADDLQQRLRKHFDGMLGELTQGTAGYRVNEYGLQPPREVLDGVAHHVTLRLNGVFAGLNRGVIDPRLHVARQPIGSGKYILLALMIILIALVLWR